MAQQRSRTFTAWGAADSVDAMNAIVQCPMLRCWLSGPEWTLGSDTMCPNMPAMESDVG